MGQVSTLLDAVEALGEQLTLTLGISRVNVDVPHDSATSANEEVILTPLMISPDPNQRNHGWDVRYDGTRAPPPPTLVLTVLVTTYGKKVGTAPERAIELLGEVARAVHQTPRLDLTALSKGEGVLNVTHMTVTPEVMDQVFSVMGVNHRSWMLVQLDPVQIEPLVAAELPGPAVLPGEITVDAQVSAIPVIERVTPPVAAVTGYIRIDGTFTGTLERVWVGGAEVLAADIDVLDDGVLRLQVPGTVSPGTHRLTVVVDGLPSDAHVLQIVPETDRTLDAPAVLSVAAGPGVLLEGRALDDVAEVLLWPDGGLLMPNQIETVSATLPGGGSPKTSLTFDASGLAPGRYRIAAATADPAYTPFVLLELT